MYQWRNVCEKSLEKHENSQSYDPPKVPKHLKMDPLSEPHFHAKSLIINEGLETSELTSICGK